MIRASTGRRLRPLRRATTHPTQAQALERCLSVLVRMIPQACELHGLEEVYSHEHDAAIEAAAVALYGSNRQTWPRAARTAAAGGYP